jgi:hypothetical protein
VLQGAAYSSPTAEESAEPTALVNAHLAQDAATTVRKRLAQQMSRQAAYMSTATALLYAYDVMRLWRGLR